MITADRPNKLSAKANMKIEPFKLELRGALQKICAENKWSFDNAKQRGMAFENWLCVLKTSSELMP